MWRISLRSVRHYWALFTGTFVALALGVALIGVSASALAATWAVPTSPGAGRPSVTLTDGTGAAHKLSSGDLDMGGVQSVLAMAGVVSAFVTVFVIAGTCAFGIALRRRDMGLLRMVGAGGPQVRRMVLGEALTVAVPAALAGCAVAAVAARRARRVGVRRLWWGQCWRSLRSSAPSPRCCPRRARRRKRTTGRAPSRNSWWNRSRATR